jgi:hypothetical protein
MIISRLFRKGTHSHTSSRRVLLAIATVVVVLVGGVSIAAPPLGLASRTSAISTPTSQTTPSTTVPVVPVGSTGTTPTTTPTSTPTTQAAVTAKSQPGYCSDADPTTGGYSGVQFDPFSSAQMTSYIAKQQGDITVAVYDIETGETFDYAPGYSVQTASIIKADILATLLWQEQQESETLDASQQQVATGMIEQSDNDDATTLWDEVGGAPGVAHFDDSVIGLRDTVPSVHWGETMTTALDQIGLLKCIVLPNSALDSASQSYELGLMQNVTSWEDWGVSAGPTAGTTVALKNGWVPLTSDSDWEVNSIGYVDGAGRDYLIAVLTAHDPSESYGISSIEGLSDILWNDLTPLDGPQPH